MRILLLFLLINIFARTNAQVLHFRHEKKEELHIVSDENNAFIFTPYGESPGAIKERSVNANGHEYKMILKKSKEGKVLEITDSTGSVVGKILTDDDFTLVLPTGEKYFYKFRTIWSYTKDNQRYMIGENTLDAGEFKVTGFSTNEIVQIAFFERGLYFVGSRRYNESKATALVSKILSSWSPATTLSH